MRDREGAELQFESDQPLGRRHHGAGHRALAEIGFHRTGDAPEHAEQEGAGADRRVGHGDVGGGQTRRALEERAAQRLVDEAHHRIHHLGRGVVGAGALAQGVVVDLEEVLVEVEPGLGVVLADVVPIHRVEHARHGAERGLQRVLVGRIVGQQAERRSDQGVRLLQFGGGALDPVMQRDVARAGDQQAERHGLGIAIGELRVVGLRKEQLAPVLGEAGEGGTPEGKLFGDLVSQEPAQPRADLGEAARGLGRDRIPADEIGEEGEQCVGRGERGAGCLDIPLQPDYRALQFAVAPEREGVAVGVEQVGQRFQLGPLVLVVGIVKPARIGALARRLDLDEADERIRARHGIVRPRADIGHPRFANEMQRMRRQAVKRREPGDERLQRAAQLVLRGAGDGGVGQLGLRGLPEGGDDALQCQAGHAIPPFPQP